MEAGEVLTIETSNVICKDVTILTASKDSVTVENSEGRILEIDLDSITGVS